MLLVVQEELASLNESRGLPVDYDKGQPVDYDTFATSAPREPREHTFVVPTQSSLVVQQPAAGAAGETTMPLCRSVVYCCGAVLACVGAAADSRLADVSIISRPLLFLLLSQLKTSRSILMLIL